MPYRPNHNYRDQGTARHWHPVTVIVSAVISLYGIYKENTDRLSPREQVEAVVGSVTVILILTAVPFALAFGKQVLGL